MTITDIKRANRKAGYHFFSPKTMDYWGSKIFPEIYKGRYFITSEPTYDGRRRLYTVRKFFPDTGHVGTALTHKFETHAAAKEAVTGEGEPEGFRTFLIRSYE